MDKSNHQRIRDLIHAYELGMVTEEQRQELELYLLDHDELLEDVTDFREIIKLLREDGDVVEAVGQLSGQKRPSESISHLKRFKPWLVPGLAMLIFVLILVLQPWQVEIRPTRDAFASENRLAVLSFANLANPEDPNNYEKLLTHLLMTDLAESHYLYVISRERLMDILNMQSEEYREEHDPKTALMAAQTAQAKWLLKGFIIQEDPYLILTTQLIDSKTGDIIETGRIESKPGQTIFQLIDQLTVKIKASLTLPEQALSEDDPPVSYVTTTSLDAYKYYLEGVDNFQKFYMNEAAEAFKKSLEYDSTMAMSYYYLSVLVDSSYIKEAVRYSDKAPRLNQKYIAAVQEVVSRNIDSAIAIWKDIALNYPDQKHANYLVGLYSYKRNRYQEAREYLDRATEIDPYFKLPYRDLAYTHLKLGNYEKAVEAARDYIGLAPDEANPYDCLGDIYLATGQFDEAIKALRQAVAIKPDFYFSALNLGEAYLISGQVDSARAVFQEFSHSEDYYIRSEARLDLACIESIEGRISNALEMLDEFIIADKVEKDRESYLFYRLFKATLYDLLNRDDEALSEAARSISIIRANNLAFHYNVESYHIQLVAFSGKLDSAAIMADRLKANLLEARLPLIPYYQAEGTIALADGRYDDAVDMLKKAIHPDNPLYILPRYLLGEAYLEAGDYDSARDVYHDLTTKYYSDLTLWCTLTVLAHYKLGLVYYNLGDFTSAAIELEKFIEIWGKADMRIEEIGDARSLLTQLKSRI